MKAIAAGAERVAEWRGQWPRQADRRARQRSSERGVGRRPCGAVRSQPCPALEAPKRAVGVRPEIPVEGSRGKSVPGERELESSHVPAARAEPELPVSRVELDGRSVRAPCECWARALRPRRGRRASEISAEPSRFRLRAPRRPSRRTARARAGRPAAPRHPDYRSPRRRRQTRARRTRKQSTAPDPHPGTRIGEIQPVPIPQKGDSVRVIESPFRGTREAANAPILGSGGPVPRRRNGIAAYSRDSGIA